MKIFLKVAGLNFSPAKDNLELTIKEHLAKVSTGEESNIEVFLEPEPENRYDPKAVLVTMNGLKVGYVSKDCHYMVHHPVQLIERKQAFIESWGKQVDKDSKREYMYCTLFITRS